MFGFCYLLVPLFNLVCKQAGINGKGYQRADANVALAVDRSRTITVEFATSLHEGLNFDFRPLIHQVDIHPGEAKLVYFYAENRSGHDITVQAVPSIAPGQVAKYLKKTECFCFTQQSFAKNEKVDMPVLFFIDPGVPKDIQFVTLNYTMFDATGFVKKGAHFTQGRIDL